MKKFMFTAIVSVLTVFLLVIASCSSSNPTTSAATAVPTSTPCTTMGYDGSSSSSHVSGGILYGNTVTASSTTVIKSLSVRTSGAGQYIALAVYSDNAGVPGILLASTAITVDTGGLVTIPITPVTLVAGTSYWFLSIAKSSAVEGSNTVSTVTIPKFYGLTWATFLASGFPNDVSALAWVTSTYTGLMQASSCQ